MIKSKFRKSLSVVLICILFLSLSIGSVHGIDPMQGWSAEMTRFQGENRYQTSAIVSSYLFDESSDYVVLARGDELGNYADALAGSYLAGFRNAPLLLTRPNYLPESIKNEILRLEPSKAYILGGIGAVHQAVEDTLKEMGLEVVRLSGSRREDTAVAIVNYVRDNSVKTTRDVNNFAFIVNGRATADALIAGSYAYHHRIPILLVNQDSLPAATALALSNYSFDYLTLIGGSGVISTDLEDYLHSAHTVGQRIAGKNRYETSVAFAKTMFPKADHYVFVGGPNSNLADGISAASFGFPILYVGNNSIPTAVLNYLSTHLSAFSHLFILGGPAAISENVATLLKTIQEALPPMITYAYIQNEGGDYTLYADIDNVNDTVTLTFAPGKEHDQFTGGYSNLSKAVYLKVSNTDEGKYDLPVGRLVEPEEDFVELILDLFTDTPPLGVNGQTFLANSGAIFTLTEKDNSENVRVYTLIVNTQDI